MTPCSSPWASSPRADLHLLEVSGRLANKVAKVANIAKITIFLHGVHSIHPPGGTDREDRKLLSGAVNGIYGEADSCYDARAGTS